jgi:hypothetical protein
LHGLAGTCHRKALIVHRSRAFEEPADIFIRVVGNDTLIVRKVSSFITSVESARQTGRRSHWSAGALAYFAIQARNVLDWTVLRFNTGIYAPLQADRLTRGYPQAFGVLNAGIRFVAYAATGECRAANVKVHNCGAGGNTAQYSDACKKHPQRKVCQPAR